MNLATSNEALGRFGTGLSQHARLITLARAHDVALPRAPLAERVRGRETVNDLYRFDVDTLSTSAELDLAALPVAMPGFTKAPSTAMGERSESSAKTPSRSTYWSETATGLSTSPRTVPVSAAIAFHTSTVMTNKLTNRRNAGAFLLTILFSQGACARSSEFSPQPFPASAARYEARLFELTEPGEKHYDAKFSGKLRTLLAPLTTKDRRIQARLTSGPTGTGTYLRADGAGYVHYSICQAHQCDTTTLDILFDPARQRMVAKLLDHCAPQWLGQPDAVEMQLLEQRQRASHPATIAACTGPIPDNEKST